MKKITAKCIGKIGKEANRNFHRVLADMIVTQYGVDFAKEVLEELKKQRDSSGENKT